jgi:uncharacterized protein (TIGR03089 family)
MPARGPGPAAPNREQLATWTRREGIAVDGFAALLGNAAGRYGDKPFLTWYDDDRPERVELSARTFENWTAKVANLLADELGVAPAERVAAVLVDSWQAAVVLAGCWRAGVTVVAVEPAADPADRAAAVRGCAAAFVREEWLAELGGAAGLVALGSGPLGRPERDLGAALDFARAVPAMGDLYAGDDAGPDAAALVAAGPGAATMAELLDEAGALGRLAGLADTDRLLSGLGLGDRAGMVAGLLAPLAAGAGVVLQGRFDPARFWKRAAEEKVTVAVLDDAQAAALPAVPEGRGRLRAVVGRRPTGGWALV